MFCIVVTYDLIAEAESDSGSGTSTLERVASNRTHYSKGCKYRQEYDAVPEVDHDADDIFKKPTKS